MYGAEGESRTLTILRSTAFEAAASASSATSASYIIERVYFSIILMIINTNRFLMLPLKTSKDQIALLSIITLNRRP